MDESASHATRATIEGICKNTSMQSQHPMRAASMEYYLQHVQDQKPQKAPASCAARQIVFIKHLPL